MHSRFSDALLGAILDQEVEQDESLKNVSPVLGLIIDSSPQSVHDDGKVGVGVGRSRDFPHLSAGRAPGLAARRLEDLGLHLWDLQDAILSILVHRLRLVQIFQHFRSRVQSS